VGLLVAAFLKPEPSYLHKAMQDRLHQPYRARLFPAMGRLMQYATEAGAWGACLSGAGPSVLALAAEERTQAVADAMEEAARALGVKGRSMVLEVPVDGFVVEHEAE
jgi:homoserine kinase